MLTTRHRLQGVPTPSAVQEQLTDILVRVVACPAEAVVPEASLKDDLGVDSLTVVELGEELGRRFGVYLSDDTIDGLVTVQDAVRAVVRHDGSTQPAALSRPPAQFVAPTTEPAPVRRVPPEVLAKRRGRARNAAILLGMVGASLGAILGLGGAALVSASGIGNVNLPPLTTPTTAETTATATPTPSVTKTSKDSVPQPTLSVSSTKVAPGERFTLEGAFPALAEGATLQVQVKDAGAAWDDFPIETKTRAGGKYRTEIYTSRTGSRQFRMLHRASTTSSPPVTVEIG